MKCKKVKELLTDFMDRNLTESLNHSVSEHISCCSGCKASMERLESVHKLLGKKKRFDHQPFYYTSLKEKMKKRLSAPSSGKMSISVQKLLQPALISLLILAGIYSGILIGNYTANTPEEYVNEYSDLYYFNEMNIENIENNFMIGELTNDE